MPLRAPTAADLDKDGKPLPKGVMGVFDDGNLYLDAHGAPQLTLKGITPLPHTPAPIEEKPEPEEKSPDVWPTLNEAYSSGNPFDAPLNAGEIPLPTPQTALHAIHGGFSALRLSQVSGRWT